MRRERAAALVLVGLLSALPGCSSIDPEPEHTTLIPAKRLNLGSSLSLRVESLLAAGAIYLLVDPLAPNWAVAVEPIGPTRYRLALKMKKFITGGEGESLLVVRRTAEKLRAQHGALGYHLIEYSEGIESHVLIAQRYAHAVVELH